MNHQHQNLASGSWQKYTFMEQMAHIGSEVARAINWRHKNNPDYSQQAFFRALELIDLTIADPRNHTPARLQELTRLREVLVDYFYSSNQYQSSDQLWHNYFNAYTYAARVNHL